MPGASAVLYDADVLNANQSAGSASVLDSRGHAT